MAQNTGSGPKKDNELLLVLVMLGTLLGMLSMLWWVASPVLGRAYAWLRAIETGGLWIFFSDWGRYFWFAPANFKYGFTSIYKSSVSFNLFFGAMILLLGFLAYRKVSDKHLRSYIQHKKPLGYQDLMRLQAPMFPANQFFLDHKIAEEYPVDKGPARMPLTALELLMEEDALEGIHEGDKLVDPNALTGWKVNEDKLTSRLVRDFGQTNPFAVTNFPFRNPDAISAAVHEIPWHLVGIIYAATYRLYALDTLSSDEFEQVNAKIDDYFKDIWRELNKCKKELGSRLVLGFLDDIDRVKRIETAKKDFPKSSDLKVYSLQEYLDEAVPLDNGQTCKRAEAFTTTKTARAELIRILTEFMGTDPQRLTPIKDEKGNPKRFSDLGRMEKAHYAELHQKQEKAVTGERGLQRLYKANGYLFGLCATLLRETRAGGILPPAYFRWMRFYDYSMWSFLRVVGMNTPTPEVAGLFDHYQSEMKSGIALTRPYLVNAIEGIRVEASKYVTDEMRRQYQSIQTGRIAAKKSGIAGTRIRDIAKQMANEALRKERKEGIEQTLVGKIDGDHSPTGAEL